MKKILILIILITLIISISGCKKEVEEKKTNETITKIEGEVKCDKLLPVSEIRDIFKIEGKYMQDSVGDSSFTKCIFLIPQGEAISFTINKDAKYENVIKAYKATEENEIGANSFSFTNEVASPPKYMVVFKDPETGYVVSAIGAAFKANINLVSLKQAAKKLEKEIPY